MLKLRVSTTEGNYNGKKRGVSDCGLWVEDRDSEEEKGVTAYKVLEAVGREVHMRHKRKYPHHRILNRLLQPLDRPRLALIPRRVELHATVRQVALLLRQPPRRAREIRQQEKPHDGDDKRHGALEDEEPAPARDAGDVVEPVVDARGDEARERRGEDVARVEHGDARGHLLARVEDGEQVHGARVVGRLGDAEEEAREEEADEVARHGGEAADDGPEHHHDSL